MPCQNVLKFHDSSLQTLVRFPALHLPFLPYSKMCHPERVRKLSEILDLFELKLPHFGCVGTVQDNCAELRLNG
jgi:hypothetical protein